MSTQFMFKTETTPGVTVTPDLTLPFIEESIGVKAPIIESDSLYADAEVKRMEATNGGLREVGGSIGLELWTKGESTLFRHMLGGKSTSSLGGGRYEHTYAAGDLRGLAFTGQFGLNMDGTSVPKTLTGLKVASAAIAGAEGAPVTLGLEVIGQRGQIGTRSVTDAVTDNGEVVLASANANFTTADIDKDVSGTGIAAGSYIVDVADDGSTATLSAPMTADGTGVTVVIGKALASASTPSGLGLYKMHHCTAKIDGSSVPIKGFELNIENGLIRDYVGGSHNSAEIKRDGDTERTFGGNLDLAYATNAQVDRYLGGIPFDLEIVATHGADSVTITGYGRYDDSPIPMAGRSRIITAHPFRLYGNTDDASALTIVVNNTDASAA